MKIPRNTVSPSQLRMYGSADLSTGDDMEADRGCPRRWKAKYVDRIRDDEFSYPLEYGNLFHRVMEKVVVQGVSPDVAITQAIDERTTLEMVDELTKDLDAYLARPESDLDTFATLGSELDLTVPLFEDPAVGVVNIRVILDRLAVDPEDSSTLHVVDYKTNRSPSSMSEVRGDNQLRAQAWVVRELASRWTSADRPRIISHLDLVKFRDYVIEFTDAELDAWATWAEALARTILRDEDARPVLNANCSTCVVRQDCPALLGAPADALEALENRPDPDDLEAGLAWRDRANRVRLLLDKAVKAWDADMRARLIESGASIIVGDQRFSMEVSEATTVDVFGIARDLGEDFPKVVTVSMAGIDRADITESQKAQARTHFTKEISGTSMRRSRFEADLNEGE